MRANGVAVALCVAFASGCGDERPLEPERPGGPGGGRPERTDTSVALQAKAVRGVVTAAQGGTVGEKGTAQVEVPAGALDQDSTMTLEPSAGEKLAHPGKGLVGSVWNARVGDNEYPSFQQAVVLRIPYEPSRLPPGADPRGVSLCRWTGDTWKRVRGSRADAATHTVSASVQNFSAYAPLVNLRWPWKPPKWTAVARWTGSLYRQEQRYFRRDPGMFGAALSSPNRLQTTRASLSIREETSGRRRRFVPESYSWSATTTDLYYLSDATRVDAGPGGGGGGTLDEAALAGAAVPDRERSYEDALEELQEAEAEVANWERELAEARAEGVVTEAEYAAAVERMTALGRSITADLSPAERDRILAQIREAQGPLKTMSNRLRRLYRAEQGLETARKQVRRAGQDLDALEGHLGAEVVQFHAELDPDDPEAERSKVSISFGVEKVDRLAYEAAYIPLEFATVPGTNRSRVVTADHTEKEVYHAHAFQRRVEGELEKGRGTIAWSDQEKDGSPGLIGGRAWTERIAFTRSADPSAQILTVSGQVLHRVVVPKNGEDSNVIVEKPNWGEISSRVLPVAGVVTVEAWLTEPEPEIPPKGPAQYVTQTDTRDGRFRLPLSLERKKVLLLLFTWKSEEARLRERLATAVLVDDLLEIRDRGTGSAWSLPIDGIWTMRTATVRFGKNKTADLPLGNAKLSASLKKEGGGLSLSFEAANSILVNTLSLRAPYVNQNMQTEGLQAEVPNDRLQALCPPEKSAEVTERLRTDAPGGRMTVDFPGYVLCEPTATAMLLGCLEILGVREGGTDQVGPMAQAIYDHHRPNATVHGNPWWFPFPEQTALWKTYTDAKAALEAMETPTPEAQKQVADAAAALDTTSFQEHWPYIGPVAGDLQPHEKKQWLASIVLPQGGGTHRVWQVVGPIGLYLNAAYPRQLRFDPSGAAMNVFDAASGPQVLNVIGDGSPALVSIKHKSAGGGEGGHLLALLGAIVNDEGEVQRLLFHDPYGDLSQSPGDEGFYHPDRYSATDAVKQAYKNRPREQRGDDIDYSDSLGAYAPYYPRPAEAAVKAWNGTFESKHWTVFRRTDVSTTADVVRGRLLRSDPSR